MSGWTRILFLNVLPRLIWLNQLEHKFPGGTFMASVEFFKRYSTRRELTGNFKIKQRNVSLVSNKTRRLTREQKKIFKMLFEMKQKLAILIEKKRVSRVFST